MTDSISRDKLLEGLGFGHPAARSRAVELLCAAGLSNPRKVNIAVAKRDRVQEVLAAALKRLCDRCAAEGHAGDERERVPVARSEDCEACAGSSTRPAIERCAAALRAAGKSRIVVLGGSPGTRERLADLWPADLSMRFVDGTARHTAQEARTNLAWADVVVIWASTELNHRVTEHYAGDAKVMVCPKRGIEALADEIAARVRPR